MRNLTGQARFRVKQSIEIKKPHFWKLEVGFFTFYFIEENYQMLKIFGYGEGSFTCFDIHSHRDQQDNLFWKRLDRINDL
jgi:hypothetical protein